MKTKTKEILFDNISKDIVNCHISTASIGHKVFENCIMDDFISVQAFQYNQGVGCLYRLEVTSDKNLEIFCDEPIFLESSKFERVLMNDTLLKVDNEKYMTETAGYLVDELHEKVVSLLIENSIESELMIDTKSSWTSSDDAIIKLHLESEHVMKLSGRGNANKWILPTKLFDMLKYRLDSNIKRPDDIQDETIIKNDEYLQYRCKYGNISVYTVDDLDYAILKYSGDEPVDDNIMMGIKSIQSREEISGGITFSAFFLEQAIKVYNKNYSKIIKIK